MHISDGVLSGPLWIGSYGATALITAGALIKMKELGLIRIQGQKIQILDRQGLEKASEV